MKTAVLAALSGSIKLAVVFTVLEGGEMSLAAYLGLAVAYLIGGVAFLKFLNMSRMPVVPTVGLVVLWGAILPFWVAITTVKWFQARS